MVYLGYTRDRLSTPKPMPAVYLVTRSIALIKEPLGGPFFYSE